MHIFNQIFFICKEIGVLKFVKWSKTRRGMFMVVSSILATKIGGLWVGSNIMCFGCYFRSFKHCCWVDTLWHQHWSLMPTHPPTLQHLSEHLVKSLAIKSKSWIQCTNILTIGILTQYNWPLSMDLENWEDFGYVFQSRKDIIKMLKMLKKNKFKILEEYYNWKCKKYQTWKEMTII